MTSAAIYCMYGTDVCRTMSDWRDFAAILGTIVAIPGVLIAASKALREYVKAREQRDEELRLKRTEFTLSQHRRLFDDPDISSVLSLVDGDSPTLANHENWDKKRKFLTFIEELSLLIRAGLVSEKVAIYMFGYYAVAAFDGPNFRDGMAWEEKWWGLFFEFVRKARVYVDDPQVDLTTLEL